MEAEGRSAAITHHLGLWLLRLVASFELTRIANFDVDATSAFGTRS